MADTKYQMLINEWEQITRKLRESGVDLSKIKLTKEQLTGEFVDIVGFEGLYQINSFGQVKSLPKLRGTYMTKDTILKPSINHLGQHVVTLKDVNGKRHKCIVSRLVAQTFIPNPDNLPRVRHIDGDKDNLNAYNLEWYRSREDEYL